MESNPPQSLEELKQRLTDHVTKPKFASALWGIKIVSLDSDKTVFELNSHKLFTPASNTKLFTVALALDRLGADYRIRTSLYALARPNQEGALDGDLILYGRGDPTINSRLHDGNLSKALEPLASGLLKAGVKTVSGDLVADESFFRGPPLGSGWSWDDVDFDYGAEISALTINDNTLPVVVFPAEHSGEPCRILVPLASDDLVLSNRTTTSQQQVKRSLDFYRPPFGNALYVSGQMALGDHSFTNTITARNPAAMFAELFRETLIAQGIKVLGQNHTLNWLERRAKPLNIGQLIELGSSDSLSIREIAREILKPSQNLYADLLLAQVGEKYRSAATPAAVTSEERGIEELNRFVTEAGVAKGEVLFEEGSGLSRDNLTTPQAIITLLHYMNRHRFGAAFMDALPIAGTDGTLKSRMKGTLAAGNVKAKTGSLRWAQSLSGYVTTAAGEHLIFAILLNRYHNVDPSHPARMEIDFIPELLAGFTGRTGS